MQTNLRLLRGIAAHPAFAAAALDTGFIARHAEELLAPAPEPSPHVLAAAVAALLEPEAAQGAWADPWAQRDSWRLNLEGWQSLTLRGPAGEIALRARCVGEKLIVERDGLTQTAIVQRDGARLRLRMDGASHAATVLRDGARVIVLAQGETHAFEIVDKLSPPSAAAAGAGRVLAPIPGRIAAVLVAVGDAVARGQPLVVLEAMKMELTLAAAAPGTVADVRCAAGDMVEEGRELVEVTADEPR